nr:unnamed protein product [Digitaria exilis]
MVARRWHEEAEECEVDDGRIRRRYGRGGRREDGEEAAEKKSSRIRRRRGSAARTLEVGSPRPGEKPRMGPRSPV